MDLIIPYDRDYYAEILNMYRAKKLGLRASDIYPKNVIRRNNAALFAMYAGNFDAAITLGNEVLQLNPEFPKAYVAIALSQLALGQSAEAAATRDTLGALGAATAKSFAASGRIDLALFGGRDTEALSMIDAAIADDRTAKDLVSVGRRLAIKGEVLLDLGFIDFDHLTQVLVRGCRSEGTRWSTLLLTTTWTWWKRREL